MSNHTPGPWSTGGSYGVNGKTPDGKGFLLADCYNANIPLAECKANAALIAAAPELLEALQEVCDNNSQHPGSSHLERARAAIDKATGLMP